MMASPSRTHVILIPSYNPGPRVFETVRAARRCWNPVWVIVDGSTDGSAEELQRMAGQDPATFHHRQSAQQGQGRRRASRAQLRGAAGLHARADDGFGRPASGRADPGIHGGFDARAGLHDSRQAGVRRERPGAAGQGPADLELVGQPRDALGGHRRFAVRVPRLSDRPIAPRDASRAFHAALRLRPRGRRAPVLDAASSRSTCRRPSSISPRKRAAFHISTTCATTRCSPGCTRGSSSASCCGCRCSWRAGSKGR